MLLLSYFWKTHRINHLESYYDEEDLLYAYYGNTKPLLTKTFMETIDEIINSNVNVAFLAKEGKMSFAHFDCERFDEGQKHVTGLRRSVVEAIRREEYRDARMATGSMKHSMQDFYSHSNWVEMGNSQPHSGLGQYYIERD